MLISIEERIKNYDKYYLFITLVFWIVGYPICKRIKHENVWESNIYVPVIWILCVLGNVASFVIAFCK